MKITTLRREGEKERLHTLYATSDVDPLFPPLVLIPISTGINLHKETKSMLQEGSYEFKTYI
jgi:hypothetical protein